MFEAKTELQFCSLCVIWENNLLNKINLVSQRKFSKFNIAT
jgi:hypothetical protein